MFILTLLIHIIEQAVLLYWCILYVCYASWILNLLWVFLTCMFLCLYIIYNFNKLLVYF
jgi:hypothetical protein